MLLNLKIPQNPFTTKEPLNLTSPQVIPAPPALWLVSSHLFNPARPITSAHSLPSLWLGLGLVINHSSPTLYTMTLGNWNGTDTIASTYFANRELQISILQQIANCNTPFSKCALHSLGQKKVQPNNIARKRQHWNKKQVCGRIKSL